MLSVVATSNKETVWRPESNFPFSSPDQSVIPSGGRIGKDMVE
jgi:hypothetical protein